MEPVFQLACALNKEMDAQAFAKPAKRFCYNKVVILMAWPQWGAVISETINQPALRSHKNCYSNKGFTFN